MCRADFTRPQCLYIIAVLLLPVWAVQTVQSLSAYTVVYISTKPMGRPDCRKP